MKRLSDTEMVDYMDGTLSPEKAAAVEAHLAQHSGDAQLLADLKEAQAALYALEAAEPVRASDDFWLKVRAELPQERVAKKSLMAQVGAWLWPSQSPMGMSLRVAAVAALLAMFATIFGPAQTQPTVMAKKNAPALQLSPQQKADIEARTPAARDAELIPGAAKSDGDAEN
jgi:anti-sigma factor RsiW